MVSYYAGCSMSRNNCEASGGFPGSHKSSNDTSCKEAEPGLLVRHTLALEQTRQKIKYGKRAFLKRTCYSVVRKVLRPSECTCAGFVQALNARPQKQLPASALCVNASRKVNPRLPMCRAAALLRLEEATAMRQAVGTSTASGCGHVPAQGHPCEAAHDRGSETCALQPAGTDAC